MKVLIIGGGIGGLTTALALIKNGFDVKVFEAAPTLAPVGAGIVVAINGMQVMKHLGIDDAIAAEGHPLAKARIVDETFRTISEADFLRLEQRHGGCKNIAIHRARLQRVLSGRLPVGTMNLGARCIGVDDDGHQVRATFENGRLEVADLLIGADGLHSRIRDQLFVGHAPRYAGQTSWRGVTSFTLPERFRDTSFETWGPGASRFGFCLLKEGEVYWFAVQGAPQGGTDAPGSVVDSLLGRFDGYYDLVKELIRSTPERQIVRTDIADLSHLPVWHKGRVALLGDAAHATTPNLGQGGNQAIEDAYVVARALASEPTPERAFGAYFKSRVKKARFIVDSSRRFGKIAHWKNPILRAMRDAATRRTPDFITEAMLDKIVKL